MKESESTVKLLLDKIDNLDCSQQLQETTSKLYYTKVELMQFKQRITDAEEKLEVAERRSNLAQRKQHEAEVKAKNAEKDLYDFKANTKFYSDKCIIELEEKARKAEEILSKTLENTNKTEMKLQEQTIRAETAEKKLLGAMNKVNIAELDLQLFKEKTLRAEFELHKTKNEAEEQIKEKTEEAMQVIKKMKSVEELSNAKDKSCAKKEILIKEMTEKTKNAEKQLADTTERAKKAEEKLKVLKDTYFQTKEELHNVQEEVKKESNKMKEKMESTVQQLHNAEEKRKRLEADNQMYFEKNLKAEELYRSMKYRADSAERDLVSLKESTDLIEKNLRKNLVEEEKKVHEVTTRAERSKKLLHDVTQENALIKQQLLQANMEYNETEKKLQDAEKKLQDAKERSKKSEADLERLQNDHSSSLTELDNQIKGFKVLEQQFTDMTEHMKNAEVSFKEAQSRYQNDITVIQGKADHLSAALEHEIAEKQEANDKVS